MTELPPEKRAELRKLAEACPFIERENTCKACDAWLFNCCCPARWQLEKALRDPELVLSLLGALDAKEAALTELKRALRKFVPSARDDRYCRNCEELRQDHYSGPFAEPDTVYCSKYCVPQKENQR